MSLRFAVVILGGAVFFLTTSPALAFTATFSWCSGSPAFTLKSVPKGTAKIEFWMRDLNKPEYNHGGGTVAYKGQSSIPCGAFNSGFNGPSPPPDQIHTYEFDIKAIGSNGETLAKTTARRKFPE